MGKCTETNYKKQKTFEMSISVMSQGPLQTVVQIIYLRGSYMQFFVNPDMSRNAPMFRNNIVLRERVTATGEKGHKRGGRSEETVAVFNDYC